MRRLLLASVLGLAFLPAPASAVIQISNTVEKNYDLASVVLVGKITNAAFNAEKKVVQFEPVDLLKGEMPIGRVVQVAQPAGVYEKLKNGDPVVIIQGKTAAIHLADTWLKGDLIPSKRGWATEAALPENTRSFPGSTIALAEVLRNKKAGKYDLLDAADDNVFTGPATPIAKAPDAPREADTLTTNGLLTLASANPPRKLQLWKGDAALATAVGPFGASGEPSAVAVRANSVTRYSIHGDKVETADFQRLTGDALETYDRDKTGFKNPLALPLDFNGDGRKDLLILSDATSFLLINRGHGVFLPSTLAPRNLKAAAEGVALSRGTVGAADTNGDKRDEIILSKPDGAVVVIPNTPAKR